MSVNRPQTPRISFRFISVVSAALALAFLAGGCSQIPVVGKLLQPFQPESASKGPIEMDLRLAQSNVRPGDAVIAFVWIRNNGPTPLAVQMLDASSIEFYAAGAKPGDAFRVRPVVSSKEQLGQIEQIGPRQFLPKTQARTFVFTTLTKDLGAFRLQAIYHPAPRGTASTLPPVIAQAMPFQVAGPRSYNRDRDGILLKEDATEIARRYVARPVAGVQDTLLGEDAMGFLLWEVILELDPKGLRPGEDKTRKVFVNPYMAAVIQPRPKQTAPAVVEPTPPDRPRILPSPILPPPK
jgi:hypothetical protein